LYNVTGPSLTSRTLQEKQRDNFGVREEAREERRDSERTTYQGETSWNTDHRGDEPKGIMADTIEKESIQIRILRKRVRNMEEKSRKKI